MIQNANVSIHASGDHCRTTLLIFWILISYNNQHGIYSCITKQGPEQLQVLSVAENAPLAQGHFKMRQYKHSTVHTCDVYFGQYSCSSQATFCWSDCKNVIRPEFLHLFLSSHPVAPADQTFDCLFWMMSPPEGYHERQTETQSR